MSNPLSNSSPATVDWEKLTYEKSKEPIGSMPIAQGVLDRIHNLFQIKKEELLLTINQNSKAKLTDLQILGLGAESALYTLIENYSRISAPVKKAIQEDLESIRSLISALSDKRPVAPPEPEFSVDIAQAIVLSFVVQYESTFGILNQEDTTLDGLTQRFGVISNLVSDQADLQGQLANLEIVLSDWKEFVKRNTPIIPTAPPLESNDSVTKVLSRAASAVHDLKERRRQKAEIKAARQRLGVPQEYNEGAVLSAYDEACKIECKLPKPDLTTLTRARDILLATLPSQPEEEQKSPA